MKTHALHHRAAHYLCQAACETQGFLVPRPHQGHAQAVKLWIELPESAAVRHVDAFRTLCDELRPYGCKVGLEHVGPEFGKLNDVHDLGLDGVTGPGVRVQD